MAYIIKDNKPQNGVEAYFVGTRKIADRMGRVCEAADFGMRANAKRFKTKREADARAKMLNQISNSNQFSVVEESIYNMKYGQQRSSRRGGFSGFGTIPSPAAQPSFQGGFDWVEDGVGYNGF